MSSVSYVGLKALGMGFDAHMTLVYFGKDKEVEFLDKIVDKFKDYRNLPHFVRRKDIQMFGVTNNTPVLTVIPSPELAFIQSLVAEFSISQYPWNPHITIDLSTPDVIKLPDIIKLDHLGLY